MGRRPLRAITAGLLAALTVTGPAAAEPATSNHCDDRHTDQLAEAPWGQAMVAPERLWQLTRGEGTTVAVIDSGVSPDHAQLTGVVVAGRDYTPQKRDGFVDCYGHGTVIAGLIAARKLAGRPFVGLAPAARILSIRVLVDKRDDAPDVPTRIASAINDAVRAHVTVINLSLDGPYNAKVDKAVTTALDRGIVVVAAAGNCEKPEDSARAHYPAANPRVIGVGGVDAGGAHVRTSCPGAQVTVAAPGIGVPGPAIHGNGYVEDKDGGTSFAAAFVSATAALLRAYDPTLSPRQIRQRLIDTADAPPGGRNDQVGYGVINPYRALTAAAPTGDGARVPPPKPLALRQPRPDPLGSARVAALAGAGAAVILIVLGLCAAAVLPRGRRRHWRPARRRG